MVLKGFVNFVREQGVVALAVGVMLGGAVSKVVDALVKDFINPLLGIILGKVNLVERKTTIAGAEFMWGDFISKFIDFIIIAAVIYFVVKGLGLDKLDRKKEKVEAKALEKAKDDDSVASSAKNKPKKKKKNRR